MKKIIIALVVLVVLVGAAVAALPLLISTDRVRAELVARIEAATGRKVRIDGPVSIGIVPTPHFSAQGIGIAGITGNSEAFSVDSISFGLSLVPLLSGNVHIDGITIVRPRALVEFDENGNSNWTPKSEPLVAPPPAAQGGSAPAPPAAGDTAPAEAVTALDRLSVDRVFVTDGAVTYRDKRSGREETFEALNLDIGVPKLTAGGSMDGTFKWHGMDEKVKLVIGVPGDAAHLAAVPIDASLSSAAVDLSAKGVAFGGDNLFAGTVTASGPSLAAFAASLGAKVPAAPAFGKFALSADIALALGQLRVDPFTIDLAGEKFGGGAMVALDRARPGIGMKLTAGKIDLATFQPAPPKGGAPAPASGGGTTPAAAAEPPIDFSALDLVDANVDFSADELVLGNVGLAKLGLDLKIASGQMEGTIRSVEINGAPGSGTVRIDRSGARPAIGGSVKMDGLDVAGLLALAGVSAPVSGSAGLDVAFTTAGRTRGEFIANLDGKGKVALTNARVTGLGLAGKVGGDKTADEIDDVNLTAAFTSLASPIAATGSLTWRGESFTVSANGDPRAALAGKPTDLVLSAASKRVNFAFTGKAGLSELGGGRVSLSTPSLRNLLSWVGEPMSPGAGLQAFSLDGNVTVAANAFSFDNASFTLDRSSGAGSGKISFGAKPSISAALALKVLDVTPYLGGAPGGAGGRAAGAASGPPPAAATGDSGGGGGAGGGAGFSGLNAFNANLNLKADEIVAGAIHTGPTAVTVDLSGGRLAAQLTNMSLYSGKGSGSLTANGAALAASFRLDGLAAQAFLSDALGVSKLEGVGSFSFDVQGNGGNQAALMRSLGGKGAVEIRDGAFRGFDIAAMLKGLGALQGGLSKGGGLLGTLQQGGGLLSGVGGSGAGDKTGFSRLAATFTIAGGVLRNDDLILQSPLLQATGAGSTDLAARTISYRIEPKLVGAPQGQEGKNDVSGLVVPIRIEGSWDHPQIVPEFDKLLQNPGQTLDQLKGVGGGLIGTLLGGGNGGNPPNAAATPPAPAVAPGKAGATSGDAPQPPPPTPAPATAAGPGNNAPPPGKAAAPPAAKTSPPAGKGAPPPDKTSPPASSGAPPSDKISPPASSGAPPSDKISPPAGNGAPPAAPPGTDKKPLPGAKNPPVADSAKTASPPDSATPAKAASPAGKAATGAAAGTGTGTAAGADQKKNAGCKDTAAVAKAADATAAAKGSNPDDTGATAGGDAAAGGDTAAAGGTAAAGTPDATPPTAGKLAAANPDCKDKGKAAIKPKPAPKKPPKPKAPTSAAPPAPNDPGAPLDLSPPKSN